MGRYPGPVDGEILDLGVFGTGVDAALGWWCWVSLSAGSIEWEYCVLGGGGGA